MEQKDTFFSLIFDNIYFLSIFCFVKMFLSLKECLSKDIRSFDELLLKVNRARTKVQSLVPIGPIFT